jgi:hypothetical protein
VPILRTLVPIPAGIELLPLRSFLIWTSLGSLHWSLFLTVVGYTLGQNWAVEHAFLRPFTLLAAGGIDDRWCGNKVRAVWSPHHDTAPVDQRWIGRPISAHPGSGSTKTIGRSPLPMARCWSEKHQEDESPPGTLSYAMICDGRHKDP